MIPSRTVPPRDATTATIRARPHARAGLVLAGTFLAAYFLVAATVGFHGPPAEWIAYGEPPVGPPVEQPLCFWTNLGFVAAGLWWLRRLDRADPVPGAPMRGPSPHAKALGLLMVWMGPASMLEHGTLTTTWGFFDAASIHWFGLFVVGYLALRAVPGAAASRRGAAIFWAGEAAAIVGLGAWTWHKDQVRMPASMLLLALAGASILAALLFGRRVGLRFERDAWRWLACAAASFAVGAGLLVAGAAGGPAAPWGHGAWHLCCALAMTFVARLLAAEVPRA